jgi:hypothetical protein
MAISKGFIKAIDVYNREMHTSLWFINDQWEKYREEWQEYCHQKYVAGRYKPNTTVHQKDKVRIWNKLCALTLVAKRRGIWNPKTLRVDLDMVVNHVGNDKVTHIEDYKAQKQGTTLMQLMRENREMEAKLRDEKERKIMNSFNRIVPGYEKIDPDNRVQWKLYWRAHPEEQPMMVQYKQEVLNKRIDRKRKRDRLAAMMQSQDVKNHIINKGRGKREKLNQQIRS